MTYEYHVVLSAVGIAIAALRYVLYFRDINRGTVKPHVFSWFLWGFLTGIIFVAQFVSGAGPAAWVAGFVTVSCFGISFFAFYKGSRDIVATDWVCFVGALGAIGLWQLTSNPLAAVIIVMIADAISYIPTYRKSFYKPQEESASGFALAASRSVFALAALESFATVNWIHTAFLVLTDGGAAVFLWVRRRQLAKRIGQDTIARNG